MIVNRSGVKKIILLCGLQATVVQIVLGINDGSAILENLASDCFTHLVGALFGESGVRGVLVEDDTAEQKKQGLTFIQKV